MSFLSARSFLSDRFLYEKKAVETSDSREKVFSKKDVEITRETKKLTFRSVFLDPCLRRDDIYCIFKPTVSALA